MACITTLQQDGRTGKWKGLALKMGETRDFNTLEDYKQYVKTLEDAGTYCPKVDPQYATQWKPGKDTASSPFMEFQVRDPATQAKYSAMSPKWEGVESSEKAVARGDYSLDSAEVTRQELRGNPNVKQELSSYNCMIQ